MQYKKDQKLETAKEARKCMVAHPGCRVQTDKGLLFKWSTDEAHFVNYVNGRWEPITPYTIDAPFTIIDDPNCSELSNSSTNTEWGSVRWDVHLDTKTKRGRLEYIFKGQKWIDFWYLNHAMKHICENAQQVKGEPPEWSAMDGFHCYLPLTETQEMRLKYALQIGATVEYLPKEGV